MCMWGQYEQHMNTGVLVSQGVGSTWSWRASGWKPLGMSGEDHSGHLEKLYALITA